MVGNGFVRAGLLAGVAATALVVGVGAMVALAGAPLGGSSPAPALAATLPTGADPEFQLQLSITQEEERAWLGVLIRETADGVAVVRVIADSPADAAGLEKDDVIEAIDGIAVASVSEARDRISSQSVGDTVILAILRDGQAQDVSVTLAAWPEHLPRPGPLLPELEGVPQDELFGHMLGGEFNFTDADGNRLTVVVEPGTVASVDVNAGTLTVNLNAGGSKTFTVQDDIISRGGLSNLQQGDSVTVMTVNGDVRAVLAGGRLSLIPGLGGGHGGWFGFGRGRFGNGSFGHDGHGRFSVPAGAPAPAGGGA